MEKIPCYTLRRLGCFNHFNHLTARTWRTSTCAGVTSVTLSMTVPLSAKVGEAATEESHSDHRSSGVEGTRRTQDGRVQPAQTRKRQREHRTEGPCKKLALDLSRMVAFSLAGYVVAGGPAAATIGFATACAHSLKR